MERENVLLIMFLSLTLFIVGATMNLKVLMQHDCKMPVYESEGFQWETDTHFSYSNKSIIRYWYFSDIIDIKPTNKIFSAGDIVMILSFFSLTISSMGYIYLLFKQEPKHLNTYDY